MGIDGLDFADLRWTRMKGGYRVPYDPRSALLALEGGQTKVAWHELWENLHHQGDVGEASYAAVPHLVRIHERRGAPDLNTYLMLAVIDKARHSSHNPEIPPDLRDAYEAAWGRLVEIGLRELATATDLDLVSSIIAVIAIGKGQPLLAGC
jgi:hypothetical protein